jgi:hypothetical protein
MAAVAVLESELAGNFTNEIRKEFFKLIFFHFYFDKRYKENCKQQYGRNPSQP